MDVCRGAPRPGLGLAEGTVGAAKEDTYQHIFQQSSLSKLLNLGIGSTNAVKSALWRHRPHFCATLRFY